MTKYLFNGSGLWYEIVSYSKKRDIAVLVDPHTGEEFELREVKATIKLAGYKVVRYDS